MFLPLRDSPNPTGYTPWVSYALIAANTLVFLLVALPLKLQALDPAAAAAFLQNLPGGVDARMLSAYDLFVFEHGYKPGAPALDDLLSSLFLHSGIMHLFGNMLFLWIYGDNVEHRLGRFTYFVCYLLCGAAATLAFALFAGSSMSPLIGASGAISGVLGFYFLFFPKNRVNLAVVLFPFFYQTFWLPARVILGAYVLIDNLLPVVIGSTSNVAYGAHLGGFFAGLGLAALFEQVGGVPKSQSAFKPWPREESREHIPLSPRAREASFALLTVEKALRRGDLHGAIAAAQRSNVSELTELDPGDLYSIARGLAESGQDARAARALRRALRKAQSPGDAAILHLALGELRLAQGQPAAAYQHLMNVLDLVPRYSPEAERAESALHALEARGELLKHWRT